ncbi:MAG: ABC transporter permease [Bacteroidota bacterium]
MTRRSVRSSSVSTVIGISLVLFMLGTLGLILLNAKKVSEYVRENIQFQVFLKDSVSDSEALMFKAELESKNFVRKVDFITKEQAAQHLQDDLGEDFISFLGYNPLQSSLDVFPKADFATPADMEKAARNLRNHPLVNEVQFSQDLISKISENTRIIAIVMLGFSALLLLISIALINNTIRLAIYSKRFLIKTMQLVGATPSFVRRPFLIRGTLQGLYAAFIAMALICALIYGISQQLPDVFRVQDTVLYAEVFGGVALMGIIIAWISTFMAVRKYVRLRSDEVY